MVGLQGIKLESITIEQNEDGKEEIKGRYALVSTQGKVVAKQEFNGYGNIKVNPSAETMKKLKVFVDGFKADLNLEMLGE